MASEGYSLRAKGLAYLYTHLEIWLLPFTALATAITIVAYIVIFTKHINYSSKGY
jgi:hypothetical protein